MPDVEVDPSRPTPIHGQHESNGTGMNPEQVIRMMLAQGFAGWNTPLVLTRPTAQGPEKYETTPAKIIAENTRAMHLLNHTMQLLLDGAIPVTKVDEHGQEYEEPTTFTQAITDLTLAIGESSDLAEQQMKRAPKRRKR